MRNIVGAVLVLLAITLPGTVSFASEVGQLVADELIADTPPAAAIADAKVLCDKIRNISLRVESGRISYKDFTSMVADIRADYDMFALVQSEYPDLVNLFSSPVKEYLKACDYWLVSITGDQDNAWSMEQIEETRLKNFRLRNDGFKSVDADLKAIDDLLNNLRKENAAKAP